MSGGVAFFNVTHLKHRIKANAPHSATSWSVELEGRVVVNDVDLQLTAFYPPGDPEAVEIEGSRVSHNIRGFLVPGTD